MSERLIGPEEQESDALAQLCSSFSLTFPLKSVFTNSPFSEIPAIKELLKSEPV
jgi:hypothetical protein